MEFKRKFDEFIPELTEALTVPDSDDWTVKGFIDYYKNIYSISTDTKVVSKIIELMIFPKFLSFAKKNNFVIKLSPHQNYYPDITFIDKETGDKYAVDLKSTYRVSDDEVNGLTLGAFTGYFRNRSSKKNVLYPYEDYKKHYVFGILYSRSDIDKIIEYLKDKGIVLSKAKRKVFVDYINEPSDDNWEETKISINGVLLTNDDRSIIDLITDENELKDIFKEKNIKSNVSRRKIIMQYISNKSEENWIKSLKEFNEFNGVTIGDNDKDIIDSFIINETEEYTLNNFTEIQSVVKNFDFFLQEKWRLAIDRPGSGNTKNIGSINNIEDLKNGNGLFYKKYNEDGERKFDTFWINYQTKGMAKEDGRDAPQYNNLETFESWVESLQ